MATAAPKSSPALAVVLFTILLDGMGVGIMIPVLPALILDVLPQADLPTATLWGGVLSTVFALMQFLFSPALGSLSDARGRKPILLVSLFVMVFYYLVMALATSIWVLFVGRIVGGITAATQSTASAYVADISRPDQKATRFGYIGAAFGMGFVLGPVLGGLLGEWGARAPFYAAALLAALNFVVCAIYLNESIAKEDRKPFQGRSINPFAAILDIGRFSGLRVLLIVFLLFSIGTSVYAAIWPFFTLERFGWSPGMIGVSLTVYGLASALVQSILIRPTIACIGERHTVSLGLATEIIALGLVASIANQWVVLALTPVAAFGSIATAAIRSLMSTAVDPQSQGQLQGVLSALMAVAMIVTPLAMSALFYAFSGSRAVVYFPGAPFLVSALLVVISLILFVRAYSNKPLP